MATIQGSMERLVSLVCLLSLLSIGCAAYQDVERVEEEGYYRREHSLAQPYHGMFWEFFQFLTAEFCGVPQVVGWISPFGLLVEAQ
jgi:hypothetical protein